MQWANISTDYVRIVEKLKRQTPYEILGVTRDVSEVELRQSYLKLVKLYHPDTSDSFLRNHHQEMLKVINQAYETAKRGLNNGKR
jgi:curved DNA-binding protein CbpA